MIDKERIFIPTELEYSEEIDKMLSKSDYMKENVKEVEDFLKHFGIETIMGYNKTHNKIKELYNVEDNWDGYNAKAPSKKIMENVEKFFKIIVSNNFKEPNELEIEDFGFVVFNWKIEENILDIIIEDNGCLYYAYYNENKLIKGEEGILIEDIIKDDFIVNLLKKD